MVCELMWKEDKHQAKLYLTKTPHEVLLTSRYCQFSVKVKPYFKPQTIKTNTYHT